MSDSKDTVAYSDAELITTVKGFIVKACGVKNTISLLVSNES